MNLVTTDVILYTASFYNSNISIVTGTKGRVAKDAPHVANIPIEIKIAHKTLVQQVLGVWYQPIEGIEQLNGFTLIDIENKTDALGDRIRITLKASSLPGISKEVRIRIFVLYQFAAVRRA